MTMKTSETIKLALLSVAVFVTSAACVPLDDFKATPVTWGKAVDFSRDGCDQLIGTYSGDGKRITDLTGEMDGNFNSVLRDETSNTPAYTSSISFQKDNSGAIVLDTIGKYRSSTNVLQSFPVQNQKCVNGVIALVTIHDSGYGPNRSPDTPLSGFLSENRYYFLATSDKELLVLITQRTGPSSSLFALFDNHPTMSSIEKVWYKFEPLNQ